MSAKSDSAQHLEDLRVLFDDMKKGKSSRDQQIIKSLVSFVKDNPQYTEHILSTGTVQEILSQLGLPSNNRLIKAFFAKYKDILHVSDIEDCRKAVFASAFQTVALEDIVRDDFEVKTMRSSSMRVHTSEMVQTYLERSSAFKTAYQRYKENAGLRQQILSKLEKHGFFENRIENLYGLCLRKSKDNLKMKIPDFIQTGKDSMVAIYIVDRGRTNENDMRDLYDGYGMAYHEYYVWSGYELEWFLSLLEQPDKINWKVYEGSYRGQGHEIWDLLNNPEFHRYYQTHSVGDTAKHFNISSVTIRHAVKRMISFEQDDIERDDSQFITRSSLSKISGFDRQYYELVGKDDSRYPSVKKYLERNELCLEPYRERFLKLGFQRNLCFDESFIIIELADGDFFAPDLIRIDHDNRNLRVHVLFVGNLEADHEPIFIERLKQLNTTLKRTKIGTIWEQELEEAVSTYENNSSSHAFSRIAYRGDGSIYAVDLDDLKRFMLTHSNEEIREHYGVIESAQQITAFCNAKNLSRKRLLESHDFESPFQTRSRSELDASQDTIYHVGSYHDGRVVKQLWQTATAQEYQALLAKQEKWNSYQENANLRSRFLAPMEKLGFVENRLNSPYGLVYRESENGCFAIPDFFDPGSNTVCDIFFINDVADNEQLRIEVLKQFDKAHSERKGSYSLFGFAISMEDKLYELLSSTTICRTNWYQKTACCRCSAVLNSVHHVELKSQQEIEYAKEQRERSERVLYLKSLADNCRDEIKRQDSAVRDIELAAAEHRACHSTEQETSLFQYETDNDIEKAIKDCTFRSPLFVVKDFDEMPDSINEAFYSYCERRNLSVDLLPFVEKLGYVRNSISNDIGLVYYLDSSMHVLVPDFIGYEEGRCLSLLCLIDRDGLDAYKEFNEIDYTRMRLNNNPRYRIRSLWSGYQIVLFKRSIADGYVDWYTFRTQDLGTNNNVWNMLNDPGFKEYYWGHSAQETVAKYGIEKHQLEHAVYVYPEFRRPDNTTQLKNIVAAKENAPDVDFAVCDGRMVSKSELALAPYLGKLDIRHNDSKSLGAESPVFFSAFGIKTMQPDFISTDRNVIVEFDGEYFHLDPDQAEFRRLYYEHIGKKVSIIWESELQEFMKNPPETIEELLERYPCTWRNQRAEIYYVLHHEHANMLARLNERLAEPQPDGAAAPAATAG